MIIQWIHIIVYRTHHNDDSQIINLMMMMFALWILDSHHQNPYRRERIKRPEKKWILFLAILIFLFHIAFIRRRFSFIHCFSRKDKYRKMDPHQNNLWWWWSSSSSSFLPCRKTISNKHPPQKKVKRKPGYLNLILGKKFSSLVFRLAEKKKERKNPDKSNDIFDTKKWKFFFLVISELKTWKILKILFGFYIIPTADVSLSLLPSHGCDEYSHEQTQ